MRTIACVSALVFVLACGAAARATGTVLVQQDDGTQQIYRDVRIQVLNKTLRLTTADGEGTLIVDRAACSYVGEMLRCLPIDMKLDQGGGMRPLDFQRGTAYLNLTDQTAQLPQSSQQVPPHSIVMSLTTRIGTIVNVTGAIDR